MTDYPAWLNVRPLTTWPGLLTPDRDRRRSAFSAPMASTRDLLRQELAALRAQSFVCELAIPAEEFRLDGRPRAHARPVHPGVVISLPTSRVGPLRYATDVFSTWTDNLRAVALGLEALRRVERYGIARRGEQYTGFRALPAGDGTGPRGEADALRVLAEDSGITLTTASPPETIEAAYKAAVKRVHPDRGGDTRTFQRLQDAIRILRGARRPNRPGGTE